MTAGRDEETGPPDERSGWRFLIDENPNPRIADELVAHDIRAEHLLDALFEGADDFDDILPYCREHWAVLVTQRQRGSPRLQP